MGRTRAVRGCLQQAMRALRPAAAGRPALTRATAADVEAPQTRLIALHGHG
ncbi:hypothetical protein [Streptomyces sp. NPDC101393]|uniref:hypothetical protein n=1 Tax=Streptomyces sp. NPDC101393 TaxID=3366141 RepID=UPI003819E9A3